MLTEAYILKHWSKGTFALALELPSKLRLLGDKSSTSWIQIAKPGTFKGHRDGNFHLNGKVFDSFLRNFTKMLNPIPLVVGHPPPGVEAPAVGYIHKLKMSGDKLLAFVEWTSRGAEMITEGAFRFCSMVFHDKFPDFHTKEDQGPTLTEVGLTNKPFLRGMDPIKLSFETHRRALSMDPEKILAAIAKALGVPDDAGPEAMGEALAAIFALKAAQKGNTVAEEEGGDEPADDGDKPEDKPAEEPPAEEKEASLELDATKLEGEPPAPPPEEDMAAMAQEALSAVAEVAGLDIEAIIAAVRESPEAIAAALAPPAEGETGDPATFSAAQFGEQTRKLTADIEAKDGEIIRLTSELEAAKKETEEGKRRIAVDQACETGILRDAQKSIALGMIGNAEQFDAFMADAAQNPAVPQKSKLQKAGPDQTPGGTTTEQRQLELSQLSASDEAQYHQWFSLGYDHSVALQISREFALKMAEPKANQVEVIKELRKQFGPPPENSTPKRLRN